MEAPPRTGARQFVIRVLHVIVSLDRGGAELALLELVREHGTDIQQSVCSIKPNGALRPAFEEHLDAVYSLAVDGAADIRALPRVLNIMARVRPTVLHTWMFHANMLGRVAGALASVPVICSVRSLELGKPLWRTVVDRATNRLATHTIAVSRAACEVAVRRDGAHRQRMTVIPNGVDLPAQAAALQGLRKGPVRVGAVGRLEPVKDHASLIRGFLPLAKSQPDATLEMVGEGSERERLERLARELGIADRVALPGEIPDAHERMAGWDVFVQSSLAEGMPRALLEAMAAGLPIVATSVGGIPEALGGSGMLVPPRSPAAIGSALLQLAGNPTQAQALGGAARERAGSRFSRELFVERHFGLYRELAGEEFGLQ